MRIVYLHQHFSTPSGSTGIRSYELATALVRKGHEVVMVCGSYDGGKTGLSGPYINGVRRGTVDEIEVVEFELPYSNHDGLVHRSFLFLTFAVRSIWLALREKYDIVFATSTPLTAGIPGIFAKWFRGKIFIFEVRDLWPALPRAMGVIRSPFLLGAMSILETLTYVSADRLIALSPGMAKGIVKKGIPASRVSIIPNGCDLGIFHAAKAEWRPEGVAPTDLLAVYSGTFGIANGLIALIDVAAELSRRGRQDIKILLIGQGRLEASLKQRAIDLGLHNIIFHPPVGKECLASLMKGADIGLQILANIPAFYYGTSPNKFFDYIASGLPVFTNYPGWLADLIRTSKCGVEVPPEDPQAFADALEAAASDRPVLAKMGEMGVTLARSEFDRKILADRFVAWIEGSVNRAAENENVKT